MIGSAETFRPYAKLARRIIRQAIQDVRLGSDLSHGKSARAFLSGSPMLRFWCEIASLDPQYITRRALTTSYRRAATRRPYVAS